jgi:uncharacterized membrane protein
MNLFEFFSENPKSWWAMGLIFMLLIARRPTLRFFQWRMERKAAEQEMSAYEILRKEINALNRLLIMEQTENRMKEEKIERLERENRVMMQKKEK